jgi:hypothetical protein
LRHARGGSEHFPAVERPSIRSAGHSRVQSDHYDPTTGIGDQSLTEYSGGRCNGAIFINTLNLVPETTGVLHFAVSEGGNRIDNVVTSLNIGTSPAKGFSLTFTERSQSS